MNYHAKFQGKILQNIDFIKCLVSYDFFWTRVYFENPTNFANFCYLACIAQKFVNFL